MEYRKVGWLYCDCFKMGYKDVTVKVIRDWSVARFIMQTSSGAIGTVEYNDGSFLDVYTCDGKLVGIEYDAECNFIAE